MSQVPQIMDCVIGAYYAFNSGNSEEQEQASAMLFQALTHPDANKFISALEVGREQAFGAADTEKELEDIDRMGDDPSVDNNDVSLEDLNDDSDNQDDLADPDSDEQTLKGAGPADAALIEEGTVSLIRSTARLDSATMISLACANISRIRNG